ncbi:MAG TPA: DUF885 domain-containing protein [Rhodanobacteraceae bacterium]|nr:DUF885 domain-containing protein [Rhodanobacteraceae bacterium]
MKTVLKWLLRLVLIAIVLGAAFFVHVWYFKPAKIDWFYGRVFAKFALQSPEMLSNMRILPSWLDFYSDKLDDASPAHEAELAAAIKDDVDVLHRYDRSALDREGRLSYDVLDYFLSMQVEGDRFRDYDFPVNQLEGIQSSLPSFMAQTHQVNDRHDAETYIARLDRFPQKFAEVLDGLRLRERKGIIPPEFTVDEVLAQMQSFVGTPAGENMLYASFKEKLDKIAPDALDEAARTDLLSRVERSIEAKVYPAYRQLIGYFIALKPKAKGNYGAWHLPDGDAYYAWCVRMNTTTDMTPEEVHTLGLAEVARISAEMETILREQGLAEGTIGARVQQLAHAPDAAYPNTADGKAAMLKRYQAILDEVNAGLGDAFDVRPKLGVEVKAVPAFAEKTAPGAYYEPGSFDGSRPGVFFANMRDTAETPKFAMRTLAYHEGIPGHHFQISVAQELKGVPFFRRVLPFTAYVEGWALYAERLAWELGFEKDPLDDLGRLRDEMMRAVRLVVDSGIHYKRWTREQAIQYMMDNTGMAESDVTAEIERYFVDPGQALAYKAGMLKILALREKAKQALGPKFRLADFHDQVLTHGALPLALLERVIDDWIAAKQADG